MNQQRLNDSISLAGSLGAASRTFSAHTAPCVPRHNIPPLIRLHLATVATHNIISVPAIRAAMPGKSGRTGGFTMPSTPPPDPRGFSSERKRRVPEYRSDQKLIDTDFGIASAGKW